MIWLFSLYYVEIQIQSLVVGFVVVIVVDVVVVVDVVDVVVVGLVAACRNDEKISVKYVRKSLIKKVLNTCRCGGAGSCRSSFI